MALCCIGGVCVPYTAVIPILLMALKWFVGKLAEYGLLPKSVLNLLGNSTGTSISRREHSQPQSSCKNGSADCCDASTSQGLVESTTTVKIVESVQEFDTLLQTNQTFVIKFTATWCMPCKKISPVYKELAELHKCDAHFLEVDVDELSRVASQFQVTVMPTFCIVLVNGGAGAGESTVVKMSGSDEKTLRSFMANHLTRRKVE